MKQNKKKSSKFIRIIVGPTITLSIDTGKRTVDHTPEVWYFEKKLIKEYFPKTDIH